MFGSSCLYLPLFIARLMSCLRCFPYDVRFVFSLPPVVYSKAHVLLALFSVRCSVRLFFTSSCLLQGSCLACVVFRTMFGSSCLYLPLFIARLMSSLRCFPYDARFVLSLPPVVYSKAHVLFALFSVRCSVRLVFTSRCL